MTSPRTTQPVRSRYRQLTVRATERITPRTIRVVLGGPELEDFASTGSDQRIKLCLPQPGQPTPLGRNRAEVFALPRERQPVQRTYTVRHFDPARSELAIDFVLHDNGGPGATWAATAAPGDQVVTIGPSPSYRPDAEADPLVLLGDDTALPAITAILRELPTGAPVAAFVEVADAGEHQRVDTAADVTWTWLHRDGVAPGRGDLLVAALRAAELGPRPRVWIGAEAETVDQLRGHCRDELGLDRRHVHALAYWRRDTARRGSGRGASR